MSAERLLIVNLPFKVDLSQILHGKVTMQCNAMRTPCKKKLHSLQLQGFGESQGRIGKRLLILRKRKIEKGLGLCQAC